MIESTPPLGRWRNLIPQLNSGEIISPWEHAPSRIHPFAASSSKFFPEESNISQNRRQSRKQLARHAVLSARFFGRAQKFRTRVSHYSHNLFGTPLAASESLVNNVQKPRKCTISFAGPLKALLSQPSLSRGMAFHAGLAGHCRNTLTFLAKLLGCTRSFARRAAASKFIIGTEEKPVKVIGNNAD